MRISVCWKRLAAALVIVSVVLLAGCGEKVKPGTAEVRRQRVSGITVKAITPSQVDQYYETSGTVAAKTVSTVASRMMGTVMSIKVKEGDRVITGSTAPPEAVATRMPGASPFGGGFRGGGRPR